MQTYDPKLVTVVFGDAIITGFADGTFINVERNEQSYTLTVGADGSSARARMRNKSGKITITLLQSSPSNDILSAILAQDELTNEGVGQFILKDQTGTTKLVAANAWIQKPPAVEFGKEVANREWVLECDEIVMGVGGTNG